MLVRVYFFLATETDKKNVQEKKRRLLKDSQCFIDVDVFNELLFAIIGENVLSNK